MRSKAVPPLVTFFLTLFSLACSTGSEVEQTRIWRWGEPSASGLVMGARPLRSEVRTAGAVLVEFKIENRSGVPIEFRPMFFLGGALTAVVRDESGSVLEPRSQIMPPGEAPIVLEAGGALQDTVDLRCDHMGDAGNCMWMYPLDSPGEYSIQLRFSPPPVVPKGDEPLLELTSGLLRISVR